MGREERKAEGFLPLCSSPDWGGRATRAEVNLDAIAANVRALASLSRGELMAVVKANAYGHGAGPVGRTALDNGATRLAVYTVDEAVALRQDGISAPILVFGPFQPAEAAAIWNHRLTPTVTSPEAAEWLQRAAHGAHLPIHVKLDTGLTRAGISPSDASTFLQKLARFPGLRVEGLYTHFASADEPDKRPTWEQFRLFTSTARDLEGEGFTIPLRHAANSAGTLDLPAMHLDMVRVGIGIYGYYPSASVSRPVSLRPALSLVSAVSRVRHVPRGTGVGYGHEFRCKRDSVIALVPVGYGDGLPRTLGHGAGRVIVRRAFAPIVGRVSMDQITIDVTDVPGVQVGDTCTLIGAEGDLVQSADDLAEQAGTISYDILTGLLPRVPRLYVSNSALVGVARLVPAADAMPASASR